MQKLQNELSSWDDKEGRMQAELRKQAGLIAMLTAEKTDWEEERRRLAQKMSAMKKMLASRPDLPQTQIKRFLAEEWALLLQ